MSPKPTKEPLERTSVQLPRQTINLLDSWPTLNRSEALRLTVDRYHYLEAVAAPQAERFVEKYRPLFQSALADMSFSDFRVVAKSLPAIVMGAMAEEDVRDAVEKERRNRDEPQIEWNALPSEIAALDLLARIGVLDYVVGERYQDQERESVDKHT